MGILVSILDKLIPGLLSLYQPPPLPPDHSSRDDNEHPLVPRSALIAPDLPVIPHPSPPRSPVLLSPVPSYPPSPPFLHPPSPHKSPNSFDVLPHDLLSTALPPSPPPSDSLDPSPLPYPSPQHSPPLDSRSSPSGLHISIPPLDYEEQALSPDAIYSPDSLDMCFDDEGLSPLEKIYLFSRSQAVFHKVYIAHELPSILPQVTPLEAVEYVLPLLNGLATDEDEAVKEALASQLVPIILWFTSNCRLTPDEFADLAAEPTPLPVQSFTPIIGTLLLARSVPVGAAARFAVVDILRRVREAPEPARQTLFGDAERRLLEQEILHQVVIGIGRLDILDEGEGDEPMAEAEQDGVWVDEEQALSMPLVLDSSALIPPLNLLSPPLPPPSDPLPAFPPALDWSSSSEDAISSRPPPSIASTFSDTPPALSPPDETSQSPSPPYPPSPVPSGDSRHREFPFFDAKSQDPPKGSVPEGWQPASPHVMDVSLPLPTDSVEWTPAMLDSTESSLAGTEGLSSDSVGSGDMTLMDVDPDPGMDAEAIVDASEQAAIGRLSSMSLMAAVSAGGYLDDDTKAAFVIEVERVGRDPVPWVRKETSYALGALAKVVPVEIVIISLLPLFESLCTDSHWHVRHSALFALPAILPRLPPHHRRTLALDTLLPLARDPSPSVRLRVLEALGEVMYTFRDDPGGPPDELLRLFIGSEVRALSPVNWHDGTPAASVSEPMSPQPLPPQEQDTDWYFDGSARALICAFNYPAVALTLGRERWSELRPLYLRLGQERGVKVRTTLAASAGEMARILGPENAARDVVPMWRAAVFASEGEVRMKAVEAVEALVSVVDEGAREVVVRALDESWVARALGGWRERQGVAKGLAVLVEVIGDCAIEVVRSLVRRALVDEVAVVREAGVSVVPLILRALARYPVEQHKMGADICSLGQSPVFRRRMTFVACFQSIITSEGGETVLADEQFWECFAALADDPIVDVRIGVARLVGILYGRLFRDAHSAPPRLEALAQRLREDSAREVASYVPLPTPGAPVSAVVVPLSVSVDEELNATSFATFSRPPPVLDGSGGSHADLVSQKTQA